MHVLDSVDEIFPRSVVNLSNFDEICLVVHSKTLTSFTFHDKYAEKVRRVRSRLYQRQNIIDGRVERERGQIYREPAGCDSFIARQDLSIRAF